MQIRSCTKGTIASFIILFILGIGLSIYYHFGTVSPQLLGYLVSFLVATSFLLGGFVSGYTSGEKGLLNGLLTALLGILFVYVIVALGSDGENNWVRFGINSVFAMLAASIGGLIGVSKN